MNNKLNKKKKKGFTLIELIVVLAVLAIIALIAIPNFNSIRENSKIKSDERSCDLIEKAVQTLVQDDNNKVVDGTYSYNETEGMLASGTAEVEIAAASAIADVVGKIEEPQQSLGDKFVIKIDNVGKSNPTVLVTVSTKTE